MTSENKTILIVEDHDMLRQLYERVFQDYKTIIVTKAEDAIPHLEIADIIVSDWEQPESKGGKGLLEYMAVHQIKKPVIIISGSDLTPKDYEGAQEFMPKPVSPSDLASRVRKYIG